MKSALRILTVSIALIVIDGKSLRAEPEIERDLQGRPQIRVQGNNGHPEGKFPLGLCEGDCDRDSDCKGDLVCFQRDANDKVPGCSGGRDNGSRGDYCIPRKPQPAPAPAPGPVTDPAPSQHGASLGGSFKLKMYWEQGYYWQEETVERKYCLKCRNFGGPACVPGNLLMVVECDNPNPVDQAPTPPNNPSNPRQIPNRWKFIMVGGYCQIQVDGYRTCLTRKDRTTLYLQVCDRNDDDQLFFASKGEFARGAKFQISPKNHASMCLTNRHHPRYGEAVNIEPCSTAQRSDTSFWNIYHG